MNRWLFSIVALGGLLAGAWLYAPALHAEGEDSLQLARLLEQGGNLSGAESIYRKMALSPGAPPVVYAKLVAIYRILGRPAEVLPILNDAYAQDPDNMKLLYQIGRALINAGKGKEAVEVFEKLTAVDPGNATYHNGRAVAFDIAGNHAAAQEIYQTALILDPDSTAIKNNLALSMILDGNAREAIFLLEALSKEPGAGATVRQNLAMAYGLTGKRNQALDISRQDLSPEQAEENLRLYEQYRRAYRQRVAAK